MKTGENYNTLYTVDDMGKPYSGASLNEVVIKGSIGLILDIKLLKISLV